MFLQFGQVLLVEVDHAQNLRHTAAAVGGRRDETLGLEQIAVHQEMGHRLIIVRVGSADVGADQDARFSGFPTAAYIKKQQGEQSGKKKDCNFLQDIRLFGLV